MNQKHFKVIAVLTVVLVLLITCVPMSTFSATAAENNYEKSNLVAMYLGTDNTGSGHNNDAKTWADLSGNGNDITDIATDANNHFIDKGFLLNTSQVSFPAGVLSAITGSEFTVEMVLGKVNSLGATWNTFINSTNDKFAWFRLISDNTLIFKSEGSTAKNPRPIVPDGLNALQNSTITLTYKVGGNITMYVDGVQAGTTTIASEAIFAEDLFFGQSTATKNFEAEYLGMRFYSKELTPAQVASNYQQDKTTLLGGDKTDVPSTNTPAAAASSTEASSKADASSKATSSNTSSVNTSAVSKTPSATTSSKTSSVSNVSEDKDDDGDNTIVYVCIIVAVVVVIAGVTFVILRKKKQ